MTDKVYLFDDGRAIFAPELPISQELAGVLARTWREWFDHTSTPPKTVMGRPLDVVDLRTPPPMVSAVEFDAVDRLRGLGFDTRPDYDYLP